MIHHWLTNINTHSSSTFKLFKTKIFCLEIILSFVQREMNLDFPEVTEIMDLLGYSP